MQVVPLHPRSRDPWFGVDAGQEVEPENDRWAYMHWFPLVQQWLEKLPISGRGSGAGEYGQRAPPPPPLSHTPFLSMCGYAPCSLY